LRARPHRCGLGRGGWKPSGFWRLLVAPSGPGDAGRVLVHRAPHVRQ
jgi:hypothetical protein